MSSKITAALLSLGIVLPTVPALYEVPVIGPAITQAYQQLPQEIRQQVPPQLRAQLAPPPAPAPRVNHGANQAALDALVRDVAARHGARVAVSVAGHGAHYTAGDNAAFPAFSTMKVPVSIAALRQSPVFYPDAIAAVTFSDNPAAHRMFDAVPAGEVAAVIEQAGSRTSLPAAYQMSTAWTTSDMAQFASGLRCVPGHEPVLEMMGRIVPEQRWGLGRIDGARFKGGWNEYQDGHVARQFGLIPSPNGDIAVAITAYSPNGYQGSFRALDELADGVARLRPSLPTARC